MEHHLWMGGVSKNLEATFKRQLCQAACQEAPCPLATPKPASHCPSWFTLPPSANLVWPCMAGNILLSQAASVRG